MNIELVEVGPRDGLQNEAELVSTEDKLAMIARLVAAGVRRLEAVSFVHPKRVPQMADAEAVGAGLPDRDDVSYIGLCLNRRGVERALAMRDGPGRGVDEAGCVLVASDSFGLKNQGQTIEEGVRENTEMIRLAKAEGLIAQVTISASFGCPFEGVVPPERVVELVRRIADAEPAEIALADTIGVAVPARVRDLVGAAADAAPGIPLRVHFHDTRNTAVANVLAAVEAGVRTVDASVGGLGGCPFAPAATGNVPTEDVLYALHQSGYETGVDLDAIIETATWLSADVFKRVLPGKVSRAGGFPSRAPASDTVAAQ